MVNKPPIGVMPKDIWECKRMVELSRAICEYIEFGNLEAVPKWVNELIILLNKDGR